MSTQLPEPTPGVVGGGRVIALLLVAAFTVILNETVMTVALPRLMEDLGITASTGQWLTTAFLLTMAVVIPVTGSLLRRFTTRTMFFAAMTAFTIGTALAATAPGFGQLLVGRVVQASGTAIMLPLLMTTLLTLVPAERRGRMMGLISIVIAVAPAIGPTVSGLILAHLQWRWVFAVMLPIAIVAIILGAFFIRNVGETRPTRFDALSIVLSALAFGGLIYGLGSIGEAATGHALISPFIPIVAGAILLLIFVLRQLRLQRRDTALIDLRPFASRSFTTALILTLISMMSLFGALILLPLYLQNVVGLGTLETGLALLPGGVLMGALAPFVGRLFDRFGPRPLVIPGAIVLSSALWLMTAIDEQSPLGEIIGVHLGLTGGLALMLTPLITSALGSLPSTLYSYGSAITSTLQQLAGAAGTALFITLMTTGTTAALAAGAGDITAQAAGFRNAFLAGAILSIAGIVLSFFVRRAPGSTQTVTIH